MDPSNGALPRIIDEVELPKRINRLVRPFDAAGVEAMVGFLVRGGWMDDASMLLDAVQASLGRERVPLPRGLAFEPFDAMGGALADDARVAFATRWAGALATPKDVAEEVLRRYLTGYDNWFVMADATWGLVADQSLAQGALEQSFVAVALNLAKKPQFSPNEADWMRRLIGRQRDFPTAMPAPNGASPLPSFLEAMLGRDAAKEPHRQRLSAACDALEGAFGLQAMRDRVESIPLASMENPLRNGWLTEALPRGWLTPNALQRLFGQPVHFAGSNSPLGMALTLIRGPADANRLAMQSHRHFLNQGVDVNRPFVHAPSSDSRLLTTLLREAVVRGQQEVVSLLLAHGADPFAKAFRLDDRLQPIGSGVDVLESARALRGSASVEAVVAQLEAARAKRSVQSLLDGLEGSPAPLAAP